jgi:outer membrane protein assembly factor BamB
MTRDERFFPDDAALDQQWDDLVRGHAGLTTEPTLRDLHATRPPAGPSPMFRAQLRAMIQTAAAEMPGATRTEPIHLTPGIPATTETARPQPVPVTTRPRYNRMRGLTGVSKAASVLLAAALLVAMLASVVRYPFGGSNGTDSPATGAQTAIPAASGSPEAATSGPSSADPGRTNQQPGPAPMGIPQLVGRADVIGTTMALSGGVLVINDGGTVMALDADTLATIWSKEVPWGAYTAPVIAGDAIYFGYTSQRERMTEYMLGPDQPNQLVSLSLKDGSENWRIDNAGAYPVAPLVVNGTVYAVGTTEDAYRLGAFDAADGHTLWTAEPFPSKKTSGYPSVIPYLWMTLAYSDGMVAVNQLRSLSAYDAGTGKEVWSHAAAETDTVGAPIISDGAVVATIGHTPREDGTPGAGVVAGFDLRTGDQQWSSDLLTGITWSQAAGDDTIVLAQVNDAHEYVLTAFDTKDGAERWTLPSRDEAANQGPDFAQMPNSTVTVGDQVVTLGIASDQGDQQRTLVTARSLATGDAAWTVILDGSANAAPIVAGGKVFTMSRNYGLQVLSRSETTATPADGTPEPSVADLRNPVSCIYGQTESPLLGTPTADRTPLPAFDRWGAPMALADVPVFDPAHAVSQEEADAIQQRLDQFTTCSILDDYTLLFNFFSTDYYLRIREIGADRFNGRNGESGETAVRYLPIGTKMEISELQVLPDGRVGGRTTGNVNAYIWFVQEDGVWKIDEFHGISDRAAAEESPSPAE